MFFVVKKTNVAIVFFYVINGIYMLKSKLIKLTQLKNFKIFVDITGQIFILYISYFII